MVVLCGIFYGILCIFSIVTGIIYASGRRKLNPLELSDRMVEKLNTTEKEEAFAKKMGIVTFIVGIVQGITSYAFLKAGSPVLYFIALGFTLFSIASVSFKLKGRISTFALLKAVAYVAILIVLFLSSTRSLFF